MTTGQEVVEVVLLGTLALLAWALDWAVNLRGKQEPEVTNGRHLRLSDANELSGDDDE